MTDFLEIALREGGLTLKGITHQSIWTETGDDVIVGGLKWFPKGGFISITEEINFAKRERGRKAGVQKGIIPANLTKRDCAGKVAEVPPPPWVGLLP